MPVASVGGLHQAADVIPGVPVTGIVEVGVVVGVIAVCGTLGLRHFAFEPREQKAAFILVAGSTDEELRAKSYDELINLKQDLYHFADQSGMYGGAWMKAAASIVRSQPRSCTAGGCRPRAPHPCRECHRRPPGCRRTLAPVPPSRCEIALVPLRRAATVNHR